MRFGRFPSNRSALVRMVKEKMNESVRKRIRERERESMRDIAVDH